MIKELENKEHQQENLLRSIINLFTYNNCSYFTYLDVKQNSCTIFSDNWLGTPLPPLECLDYSTEIVKYTNDFVIPGDREHVIREMRLKRAIEQLEQYEKHVVYCGVEDPIRDYTRKKLEYRYYDRDEQMVLLSRTDLTDLYLEQQRQQKELQEALKIAEEANRTKSQFFSNMSHDIRTPTNAIVRLATLLEKEASNKKRVQEYTKKILNSSKLLLPLLNDVLDISQIGSGRAVLNIPVISILGLVNELDTMIRPQAQAWKQESHVQIEPMAHRHFSGDKTCITQVLMNILNNAVKYIPDGRRIDFIVSSSTHWADNQGGICLAVKDTGIGIVPDFVKDLYEPFSRESSPVVDQIQGTGLGLPITKDPVGLMGGVIQADSEEGKGSTLTVRFRSQVSEESSISPRTEGREGQKAVAAGYLSLQGTRALAAEDNELSAEILSELLHIVGVECEIVPNGQAVVRRFQELQPGGCDLILTDVRMSVMDGCETTCRIRQLDCEQTGTIPIITITANAFTEDVKKVLDAGMNAHLPKPVDVERLTSTIRKYVYSQAFIVARGFR